MVGDGRSPNTAGHYGKIQIQRHSVQPAGADMLFFGGITRSAAQVDCKNGEQKQTSRQVDKQGIALRPQEIQKLQLGGIAVCVGIWQQIQRYGIIGTFQKAQVVDMLQLAFRIVPAKGFLG